MLSLAPVAGVTIFLAAGVFIAAEKWVARPAALGGAAVMLALGLTNAHTAFFSEDTGVDWIVIFLLLGVMIIVSVMRKPGFSSTWRSGRASARGVGRIH